MDGIKCEVRLAGWKGWAFTLRGWESNTLYCQGERSQLEGNSAN